MQGSNEITELAGALVKAQSEFSPAVKNAKNPHYKSNYLDLAGAIDAAQPALLANGIAVLQGPSGDTEGQSISVTTRLVHTSGQWLESTLTLPAANRGTYDAQSVGSAITYGRRYAYMAMLGFAAEDDDGNAASGRQEVQAKKPTSIQAHAVPDQIHNSGSEAMYAKAVARQDVVGLTPPFRQQLEQSVDQERGDAFEGYDASFMDDGNERPQDKPVPQVRTGGAISEKQAKRFNAIAMGRVKDWKPINNFLAGRGYERATEIVQSDYEACIVWAETGKE